MSKLFLVDYVNKYSIYFSNPKTWVMWAIIDLHDYLMFFLINIFVIVLCFLFICVLYRYRFLHIESLNLPSYVDNKLEDVNHAPYLELFWTMVPVLLLFIMGWPSFRVLYAMEQLIDPYHTVMIIGNQWYWTYQYSDIDVVYEMIYQLDTDLFYEYKKNMLKNMETNSKLIKPINLEEYVNYTQFIQIMGKHFRTYEESSIIYDSVIISDESLPIGYPRLLSVDQVLILPANISIRLLVTSTDVIHSWALPSHGLKMDAIPGRINQIPFLCSFWGSYWGQCSELCGINHGFMPIEVKVIPFHDYISYLELNLAFRYEKFIPLLAKFFNSYLKHLEYRAEKDLYVHFINEFVFSNQDITLEKFDFLEFSSNSGVDNNFVNNNIINNENDVNNNIINNESDVNNNIINDNIINNENDINSNVCSYPKHVIYLPWDAYLDAIKTNDWRYAIQNRFKIYISNELTLSHIKENLAEYYSKRRMTRELIEYYSKKHKQQVQQDSIE